MAIWGRTFFGTILTNELRDNFTLMGLSLILFDITIAIWGRANGDVPDFAHFNTTSTCKRRHVPIYIITLRDKGDEIVV